MEGIKLSTNQLGALKPINSLMMAFYSEQGPTSLVPHKDLNTEV